MLSDSFADGIAVLKAIFHFFWNIPNNTKKRRRVRKMATQTQIKTILKIFVVFEYYLKGRKRYRELGG